MPVFDTFNYQGLAVLYETEWRMALQQMGSRARPYVDTVPVNAGYRRFRTIQSAESTAITTRFGETNPTELGSELRSLFVNFSKLPLIADRREIMQLGPLGNPLSRYMDVQRAAAGRDFDRVFINGILGPVLTGTNNTTSITLPTAQDIPVNYAYSGAGTNTGMTVDKIQAALEFFIRNNLTGQGVENYSEINLGICARQWNDLLHENKIIDRDFNPAQPLSGGYLGTWMGVNIIVFDDSILPYVASTDIRTCVMWARRSVVAGIAEEFMARMSELDTKNFDYQLYAEWGWGATRLDEAGVLRIFADQSP